MTDLQQTIDRLAHLAPSPNPVAHAGTLRC